MAATQQYEIVEIGLATVAPVLDVMGITPTGSPGAAGDSTPSVTDHQRSANRGRDGPGCSTHIEDRRIGTRDYPGDLGIAGDTPSDLRSDDAGIFKFTRLAGATFESLQRQQHRNL